MQYQGRLGETLAKLFPDAEIITNARKLGSIVSATSQQYLELDFWIPSIHLALEYQDPHHYVTTWYSFISRDGVLQRDDEKKRLMEERGDTLVPIPCWWDGDEEKLVATIREKRPDLLSNYSTQSSPIDPEPPPGFFKIDTVPGVGELMIATFGLSTNHISSWWISEKYDGLRICWNPLHQKLYTRAGRKLDLAINNLKFPPIFLDAEIWFGRGSFKDLYGILTKKLEKDEKERKEEKEENGELIKNFENSIWDYFRMVVFDSPNNKSNFENNLFEQRFSNLINYCTDDYLPLLEVAPVHETRGKQNSLKIMKNILEDGGEGIIARKPQSIYAHGRSDDLLKFKADRDQEAMVKRVEGDNIILQLPNLILFTAKMNNTQENSPKPGDVVTFVYSYLSPQNGMPMDAKVVRTRDDVTWSEVVTRASLPTPRIRPPNPLTSVAYSTRAIKHPIGHWTNEGGKNIKLFFDEFARKRNMDPLVPDNWYNIVLREILQQGGIFMNHYRGSIYKALSDIYPNIGLLPHKFSHVSRNFWSNTNNLRQFFDAFAKKKKFDPLIAKNWYLVSVDDIIAEKSGGSVLYHFNNSHVQALMAVYPSVNLQPSLFGKTHMWTTPASKKRSVTSYWFVKENRKRFFDNFANKRGLDASNVQQWKEITREDILKETAGVYLLKHYGGSLSRALRDIYGFEKRL